MLKLLNAAKIGVHQIALLLFLASTLVTAGCGLFGAHTKVQVPQLLTPLTDANKASLIQEVNRLAAIKSIHGKIDIQFEDTSFASSGIAEKYRQVDGAITLQRPGQIYLIIQFTFVDIAQMASDGAHFSVAVLKGDDKYRRFVKGTNNAMYPRLDGDDSAVGAKKVKQKTEKETVSALSNLRPQHLTDALMIRPITADDSLIYSQSQFFQEEPDNRPQAKKGTRIMRGYYLLEEFSQPTAGEARLLRRFWFDRVGGIRLARLQTFDERGFLITDVGYSNEKTFGNGAQVTLPSRIELTRPQDQYKLSITYQDPASVELNKEFRPEAFILENKWQLPEVDLDAQRNKKVTANH
jgi:hypothetical protein